MAAAAAAANVGIPPLDTVAAAADNALMAVAAVDTVAVNP